MRFQEVTSFPKICNEIMHHLMLSLIVMNEIMEFCVTFWCSTTESKNIVKLLAISQTNHTVYCEEDYFPNGNLNYLIVCFT